MTGLRGVVADVGRTLDAQWTTEDRQHRYRDDPVGFCRDVLRFEAWSKQREILEAVRSSTRTAVRSCHGAGKTAIAARAALWFLHSHPGSRVITTAPTWEQVKNQLWREIHAAYHEAPGFGGQLFDTRLEMGGDWFALGLSTDKPERFQGHHAEHLLLVVDEASGVNEGIYEAAAGYMTAHGARLLLIGNPTQLAGTFYRAFHSERAAWRRVTVSVFDTPAFTGEPVAGETLRALPTRSWLDDMRGLYGEESPMWEVRVLGEFPSTADDSVVPLGLVEEAQRREVEPTAPVVVACDVARFGSDETIVAVRSGGHVRVARRLVKRDLMEVVGAVVDVCRGVVRDGLDLPVVVVDDAGVGGGVVDRLRELRRENGWHATRVVAFNGAGRAHRPRDYPNRRSELWFEFAERLPGIDLDEDEQLAADLVAPRYTIDSQGRRVVEPKERTKQRLGRSPDRADAVLMTVAWDRRQARTSSDEEEQDPFGQHSQFLAVDDRYDGVLDVGLRGSV